MPHLDIVTCVANPIGWSSRTRLAAPAILSWLEEPEVRVTLVECAYGARDHELAALADHPRVTFVPVRATTMVWNKENLHNIGFSRAPADAEYFGSFDADIHFRRPGWARNTIRALDLHPVVQPWSVCYDLGPNDEHIQTHTSFARLFREGKPVTPKGEKFWKSNGGYYEYAHPGFAWAWTRKALDRIGGLFELGAMGSGDHHMALGIVGLIEKSVPGGAHPNYLAALKAWECRAQAAINQNLGFVHGTIEHRFHGAKDKRGYIKRWGMFLKHNFDPLTGVKFNSQRVIEWAGDNPELEREFHVYLMSREEDSNVM
jgi:hypothetical protein